MSRRLADRYVLGAELGAGGMSSLFRARDEKTGAAVAIKILKRALLEDAVVRERFKREAVSIAKLDHPGIVRVLDFGEDAGDPFTVLELLEGETLERVMANAGPMTIATAHPIVDRVLAALEVCHDAGVVHRDVKPSNVMVDAHGGVKLIDFGLARVAIDGATKLTETGAVQGTPRYMAPEQCRGEEVGPAGDVYAAGVVFYEMLAGAEPFRGRDAATFMAQHLFVDPPRLADVAPHVSAGLSAAIHRALAKDPEARPSARALREAIAAAARGTDPEARANARATSRQEASRLGRRDRSPEAPSHAPSPQDARARVVVWMDAGERSAAIHGCLGTAGYDGVLACTPAVPDLDGARVVVVSARALERVARLRTAAARLPVVVVDVDGPDDTTAAIRAGARDMLLRQAALADLPPKIARIVRRGTR